MPKANKKKINDSGLNFEAQLWAAADKVHGHMDASEYKHVCLGLTELHSDLKADFFLANPPFNLSDWGCKNLRWPMNALALDWN
jgi:type I restriction-modification system DNA methylase subunit